MTTWTAILGFATVSLAIAISPGPSWIYAISTTAGQGRRAGFVAVVGNAAGILCHVLAAALGLSALLRVSTAAYLVLRWAGAIYLVYLGGRMILGGSAKQYSETRSTTRPLRAVFRSGLLVNVLNPKMALLMLALLPQFVDPERGSPPLQTFAMGLMHVGIASSVLSTLVVVTSHGRERFRPSARLRRVFRTVSGSVLIGWGVRMAWGGSR